MATLFIADLHLCAARRSRCRL
ncbi:hypothetical protein, partial [Escherichia coli]